MSRLTLTRFEGERHASLTSYGHFGNEVVQILLKMHGLVSDGYDARPCRPDEEYLLFRRRRHRRREGLRLARRYGKDHKVAVGLLHQTIAHGVERSLQLGQV